MSRAAVSTRGGPTVSPARATVGQQAGRSAARRVEIIMTRRSQRHGMGGHSSAPDADAGADRSFRP
jgi:hypothetical protein